MTATTAASPHLVRRFREILLWPLQLAPLGTRDDTQQPWELLQRDPAAHPWREVDTSFAGDPAGFQEPQYTEFVSFLPFVQRILYGEGVHDGESVHDGAGYGESSIRVFRREDVARARVVLDADGDAAAPPVELEVAHVELYFFADVDIVIPVVELCAGELSLARAQDLLFRFGRAYPAFWQTDGLGGRCPVAVEWLSRSGDVLARSDYEDRPRYLASVARHRAPCIAAHWEWLLQPLVPDVSERAGPLRYRQLEYYRMPLLGYLALDDPGALSRADFVSLGLVTGPTQCGALPFSARSLERFEADYCYDRYWAPDEVPPRIGTRLLCSGHAFFMVGAQGDRFFTDPDTGLLAQFRRQYFLVGLIAHLHKAALLMLSDRLVFALGGLDIRDAESIKRFKRQIRRTKETFLRFTHRYWFHEMSTQDQTRDLFRMWSRHLDTDRLYAEVREEIQDMMDYLDSDSLRRQANTVVRLTVVTTLGLVWTVATGVLGMNLFALADYPWYSRVLFFLLTLVPSALVILYTVFRAKPLAEFLELISDTRVGWRDKLRGLKRAW